MAKLTFFGRSHDGDHLLLKDQSGKTYTLTIDTRLRKALRAESDRNGQLEIQMESTLRPRDIQARIRAGETPEAVANAAGTSVDKIMPFAAPVLAERAHVAQRAQLSSVRRRTSDQGARTLGEAVEAQLRAHNTDPDSVEWDAWRREDGRWTLTAQYSGAGRNGTAAFSFDMRGNFVTLDDDDARWLVGDGSQPAEGTEPASAPQRHLSAVPAEEIPLGTDAIEMVTDSEPETSPDVEAPTGEAHAAESPEETTVELPATEPASGRKPSRRRGRASVPSWDEIMFGGGKND